jgi:hypothetical protein
MNGLGRANRHVLAEKYCVIGVSRDGHWLLGKWLMATLPQQTCEDGQNQKIGMKIRGSLKALRFHPGELILVHAV